MFLRNLICSLKILFKNKILIFWTFIFPIVLGILFNMAFSNIESEEMLDIIEIGIVEDENFNNNYAFKSAFSYLSDDKNENKMFNITYDNIDNLKEKLEDNDIVGYLYLDNGAHIVINKNGIDESVFKFVTEEINMVSNSLETIETKSLDEIVNLANNFLNSEVSKENKTNKNMSYTMIEFYSLIAMTCLYGATLSMYSLNQVLPNMSNKGKRVAVSPISKTKIILSSLCASFIAQVIGVLLLFIFTVFVLKVDYGSNILLVLLLALAGSLSGLSLGVFVSTFFKKSENSKLGIIISITMVYSFLAGMMGITMKYIIDKNLPLINIINPVNMITDGLYSLYYYDTYNRYIFNIVSLLIFSFILIGLSYFSLRRQKYDSI